MAAKRVSMRKIREVLRLKYELGFYSPHDRKGTSRGGWNGE